MRRITFIICVAAIMFVPAASRALSGGIGLYGSFSYGHSYWNFAKSGYVGSGDKDEKNNTLGWGILMDTTVARDSLINYRLEIGYDRVTHSFHSSEIGDLNLHRILLSNTLGFGIIRSEDLRFWLGPQLRLSYCWGEDKFYEFLTFPGPTAPKTQIKQKFNYMSYRADLGITSGVNIHFPGNISLGLECGWRAFLGDGERKIERSIVDYYYGWNTSIRRTEKLEYTYGYETFVNVCVLYRINDKYK